MLNELIQLAEPLAKKLLQKSLWLAVAESCTGGELAYVLTCIPGSSKWFERGFVTYSDRAKQEMLGVAKSLLQKQGAVSEAVAKAMVQGVLSHSSADLALSITGIAGPTGGSKEKPVGTVWIGLASRKGQERMHHHLFQGTRIEIRHQATRAAIEYLLDF